MTGRSRWCWTRGCASEVELVIIRQVKKDCKVGRDVPGAPVQVRGGSNRNAVEMAHRQRPRPPMECH